MIAEKMCSLLSEFVDVEINNIAEFGCGTGIYSRLLYDEFMPSSFWRNDICQEAGEINHSFEDIKSYFSGGDMEKTELPADTDLITGCSVIQWFTDPEGFFKRCSESLKKDGYLAFTAFGKDNFREIKQLTGSGLNYHSAEEYFMMLLEDYDIIYAKEESVNMYFPDVKSVLMHIKNTGVGGTTHYRWTKSTLDLFEKGYNEKFSTEKGLSLTYNPIYIIAKLK